MNYRVISFISVVIAAFATVGCDDKDRTDPTTVLEVSIADPNPAIGVDDPLSITTRDLHLGTNAQAEIYVQWDSAYVELVPQLGESVTQVVEVAGFTITDTTTNAVSYTHSCVNLERSQRIVFSCHTEGTTQITVVATWEDANNDAGTNPDLMRKDASVDLICGSVSSDCNNDDTADGTEDCDGTDLAGETCTTLGYESGELACNTDCTFDTTGCTSATLDCPVFIADDDQFLYCLDTSDWSVAVHPIGLVIEGWGGAIARGDSFMLVGGKYGDSENPPLALYSPDGLTWTDVSPTEYINISSVIYGAGSYVIWGSGTNLILTTDNGATWNDATMPVDGPIAYGGGTFMNEAGYHSTDADTWTAPTSPPPSGSSTEVAYGDGRWIVMGDGSSGDYIWYSDDGGDTWAEGSGALSGNGYSGAAYGNGRFVALKRWNDPIYSDDGATWSDCTITGIDDMMMDVTYHPTDGFIAVTGNEIFRSDDGITWTEVAGDFSGMFFTSVTATE